MKKLYSLWLIIMTLSLNNAYSQSTQKILFNGESKDWENQFCQANNLETAYILYCGKFVGNDLLPFNKKLMVDYMDKMIPDKNATGYAILDWEGYMYNVVHGVEKVTDFTYNECLNHFIAVLRYAKLLRPGIKWGYYDIPQKTYAIYSSTRSDMASAVKRVPLLIELDFFAPSFYLYYDGKTISEQFISQFIDSNIRYTLMWAKKMNKPVYAYVWHRYMDHAGYPYENKLFTYPDFGEFIKKIVTTKHYNAKLDGIIWWNCDYYLYWKTDKDAITQAEFKNITNLDAFRSYELNLLQNYLNQISALFK